MTEPAIPGLQFTAILAQNEICTTWKATQVSLQREVDVRVLNPSAPPDQAAHFLAISRTIARLTHPGLAQIYDVLSGGGATHVVMEHVAGASLAEMVAGTGRLNPTQALRLALQLAEVLDCAWTQEQVVFRSLKPQNLRVNSQGILKISEYGLAIQVKPGANPLESDHGHIVGTPHYISPEQATASPAIDFRADMYALGAILYFLLTAKSPFEGLDSYEILKQQVSGQIPHPRTIAGHLPMPLCQFIARLMMKQPRDRYPGWDEVLRDLQLLQAGRAPAGRTPDAPGTIAPLPGHAYEQHDAKVVRRGTTSSAANPERRMRSGVTPGSSALWLLLMLWFAWLANERLGNPLRLPPALVVDIGLPALGWPSRPAAAPGGAPPTIAAPLLPAVPPADITAAPVALAQVETVLPPAAQAQASTAEPAATTADPAAAPSLVPMLTEAAALLATGDLAGTLARLDTLLAAPSPAANGIKAVRDALKTLPDPLDAVGSGLLAQRGKETVIRYQGRDRKILPRAVVNGELQAEFLAEDGTSRPVTFRLDKLDAAEQLRWLPAPQTPADHAVACLLALRAGDAQRFRAHRDGTGALAPLFAALNP